MRQTDRDAPFRAPYFHRVARDLWHGDWDTIVATRRADDSERVLLEATILCSFGRSVSLRGAAEEVRDALARARHSAHARGGPARPSRPCPTSLRDPSAVDAAIGEIGRLAAEYVREADLSRRAQVA